MVSTGKVPPGGLGWYDSHSNPIQGAVKGFHINDGTSLVLFHFVIEAFTKTVGSCLHEANELCLKDIFN